VESGKEERGKESRGRKGMGGRGKKKRGKEKKEGQGTGRNVEERDPQEFAEMTPLQF